MDPSDKYRSFFQMPRRTNIQNDWCVTLVKQPGHERVAEISLPSGQQNLHYLSPTYLFSQAIRMEAGAFVGIE